MFWKSLTPTSKITSGIWLCVWKKGCVSLELSTERAKMFRDVRQPAAVVLSGILNWYDLFIASAPQQIVGPR